MTSKKLFIFFLTALFFLGPSLWAQSGRYVIEQRYEQKLVWVADKYALKYEVLIERNEGKGYRPYLREFTEQPSYQLSVPPGNYRYRIIPYDYLEQPGDPSAWIPLDIKPAPITPIEGQKTEDGSYVLEPQDEKPVNFYINAAWAPLIPIYGGMHQVFGSEFYAAGAMLRFGLLFNTVEWFNPGMELSTSWYKLNKDINNDNIGIQAGATGLNFVARKYLPNRSMALTLRTGCALAFQIGEITTENYLYSMGGMALQLNLELSFLWFALKHFYMETGVGFNHLLFKDNYSGCLRPWLGAGWQF